MNEVPFYKAMLFWQKNATESLLAHQKELSELDPGHGFAGMTHNQKQYEYAIANVSVLEKALPLMQQQWYRDHGPLSKPD